MIFLTVGTQFPFDRLVKTVDDLVGDGVLTDEVVAQIGDTTYKPKHFEAVSRLDKTLYDRRFKEASAVISHAGTGTITMAMDNGKSLLAMPRRKQYGEVVNDHQVAFADKFAALGYILVASDERQLRAKLLELKAFIPAIRRVNPQIVAERIDAFLGDTAPGWRFHGLKHA